MCSTFCGIDVNYYEPFIDAVVANVPSWIFRERQDCSDRLMSLSMTQLQPVLQLLQISNCRRKCDVVGVIVDDFLGKRLEFCNSLTRRDQPWTFAVAKTKWSRGPACARRYDANIHHKAHDHQLLVTWTNSGT